MATETRIVKRKRSLNEPAVVSPRKKTPKAVVKAPATKAPITKTARTMPAVEARSICPLIQTLRQYGLMEIVASCLGPSDLFSLALSCRAAYEAMIPRAESLNNLLSKMSCSGRGVSLRQRIHEKSTFFYAFECTEFAQCRTASGRHSIESRPCISCKLTTCDECRIHCVFQSIHESPSDPEDLPNFSGFVLLEQYEVGILSPRHLDHDEALHPPAWQNRATDATAGPYHDQGYLDLPLQFDEVGTPEKISDVINVDLGYHSLTTWSGNSQYGFPSPVLRSLCNTTEQRILYLCKHCLTDASDGYKALEPPLPYLPWLDTPMDEHHTPLKQCHCSLRSRILDRWQCVKCYAKEASTIETLHNGVPAPNIPQCGCGRPADKPVCMWCWGEIAERSDQSELIDDAQEDVRPRA
ncbi:hypothetical protein C7974DRAFT_65980 [Boeremia exigua]|uniref:uncharacterized protein n=1 Tax=Boeremia exigua TaxID=749465 RepID=UPI001E8CB082|nr:uncharacterized protein C7974DRAFT_65980 [Boeremia exigua]KAH6613875.1 hypothetical protein C7974DRAFT_65980 [Boeremia exigua]